MKDNEMVGTFHMSERYLILAGIPEGKLGRPRRRQKTIIKMTADSSDVRQGPMVGSYEHSNGPIGFIRDEEFDRLNEF
jgi:hypothetical protein